MEKFKGDQHHSSRHPGPDSYRGKKAVIIRECQVQGNSPLAFPVLPSVNDVGNDGNCAGADEAEIRAKFQIFR